MKVHKGSKSLLLRLRPESLAEVKRVFPRCSKDISYQGHNIALPFTIEIVKILRNMGIKVPSPIRHFYDWPRPARFEKVFEHQYATAEFLTLHNKGFVLNEMGTLKTSSTLWAADYMMQTGGVKRVLIVAPLPTLSLVWMNEIFSVCMHRTAVILHGPAGKRKELLEKDFDFYIVNHDGLKILQKEIMVRKDIDLVIVDEAADYRNGQTSRYEILKKITTSRKLWCLTGAPCPNAPTDAWALARLVDPSRVPNYFTAFKRNVMNQVTTHRWVPKTNSHEIAFAALQPAIRFKKRDCIDLPPVTYTSIRCELSEDQIAAYKEMKKNLVAEAKEMQITAVNAADKIGKLRQILCGAIKITGTHDYVVLDHAPRLKVLTQTIERAAAKVLIIVPFKGIATTLVKELQEYHDAREDGKRVALVNGDVSISERNKIFQEFRDDTQLNELVCHPKVMSHGLNMTEADMVIFYAPIYSNDQDAQVMDRINRPGQTRNMTIARITSSSLEDSIYAMISDKATNQGAMLDLYRNEFLK